MPSDGEAHPQPAAGRNRAWLTRISAFAYWALRLEDFQLGNSAQFQFALRALQRLIEQSKGLLLDSKIFASGNDLPIGVLRVCDQAKNLVLNRILARTQAAAGDGDRQLGVSRIRGSAAAAE